MKTNTETIARRALLAVCVAGFARYGSTKGIGTVAVRNADTEVDYLADNGSYATNDFVHVALTRSGLLPDSADFYVYYGPIGNTNSVAWTNLLTTTMGAVAFPTNVPFANAWSNDWIVGTSYVRQQVHTNGVADLLWIRIPGSSNAVPFRTGIYINGEKQ